MIPKASQREGGQNLATHLLNEFDNERVHVDDVRGAIASDLHGAFAEWEAVATATKCRKYLYSLSINPDPDQRVVTREEYYAYIARVEKALGLSGQPRAVIFHVKHGREHAHIVWSRINGETLKAVHLAHDRQKLRTLTREFAAEHGLHLPPGMTQDRGPDRFKDRQKRENLAEKQQEERTGISKAERIAQITAAWKETDTGPAFSAALEKRGYFIARGDRRAYVAVDLYGEVHSLARQIEGVRAKDVKARLAVFPLDKLPDAMKAQVFARVQLEAQRAAARVDRPAAVARLRADLGRAQAQRREALDLRHEALKAQHASEREALAAAHEAQDKGVLTARLRAQPKGMVAFLVRITGIKLLIEQRHKRQDRDRATDQQEQRAALGRRHDRELVDFSRHYRALDSLDKREARSLETALRREEFRAIAQPRAMEARLRRPADAGDGAALTPDQRARLEAIRQAGFASEPVAKPKRARSPRLSDSFEKAARRSSIREIFADAASPRRPGRPRKPEPTPTASEPSRAEKPAPSVRSTFNDAAGGRTEPERPPEPPSPPPEPKRHRSNRDHDRER